jgi:hypothetical protein
MDWDVIVFQGVYANKGMLLLRISFFASKAIAIRNKKSKQIRDTCAFMKCFFVEKLT